MNNEFNYEINKIFVKIDEIMDGLLIEIRNEMSNFFSTDDEFNIIANAVRESIIELRGKYCCLDLDDKNIRLLKKEIRKIIEKELNNLREELDIKYLKLYRNLWKKYNSLVDEETAKKINDYFFKIKDTIRRVYTEEAKKTCLERLQYLEGFIIQSLLKYVKIQQEKLISTVKEIPEFNKKKKNRILLKKLISFDCVQFPSMIQLNEIIECILKIECELSTYEQDNKFQVQGIEIKGQQIKKSERVIEVRRKIEDFFSTISTNEIIEINDFSSIASRQYNNFEEFINQLKKRTVKIIKNKIKFFLGIKDSSKDNKIISLIEQLIIINENEFYVPSIEELSDIIAKELEQEQNYDDIDSIFDSDNINDFQSVIMKLAQNYCFTMEPTEFCKKIVSRARKLNNADALNENYLKFITILNEAVILYSDPPEKNVFFPIINHNILSSLKGKYSEEISSVLLHIIKVNENIFDRKRYPMQVYRCMVDVKIPNEFKRIALEAHSGKYDINKDDIRLVVDQLKDGTYYIRARVEHGKNESVKSVYRNIHIIKQDIDCSYENQIYVINECLNLLSMTKCTINISNFDFIIQSIIFSLIRLYSAILQDKTLQNKTKEELLHKIDKTFNSIKFITDDEVTYQAIATAKQLVMLKRK